MATEVRFRRGSTAEHSTFTGAGGEMTVDTTKDTLVAHDGSTAGGHPMAKESELISEIATVQGLIINDNLIINGNTSIAQRGTTFPAALANTYIVDRWKWGKNGVGVVQGGQSASSPHGSEHSTYVTVTTGDASIGVSDFYFISQAVEGNNMRSAKFGTNSAESLTLSFWVRSPVTGIHSVGFRNSGNDRSYIGEYTIVAPDTWEYKTITIAGDITGTWAYDNTKGMDVMFSLGCGSNFTKAPGSWGAGNYIASTNQVNVMPTTSKSFHITQVKLEIGDEATPYRDRLAAEELAMCQRYYCKSYAIDTVPGTVTNVGALSTMSSSSGHVGESAELPVEMRASPTYQVYSPSTGTAGYYVQGGSDNQHGNWMLGPRSVSVASFLSSTGNANVNWHFTADAEL